MVMVSSDGYEVTILFTRMGDNGQATGEYNSNCNRDISGADNILHVSGRMSRFVFTISGGRVRTLILLAIFIIVLMAIFWLSTLYFMQVG